MNFVTSELNKLFERDLNRMVNNLELIEEENLWRAPEGVENSCGVLTQHLVGNLRHFIGAGLGETGYERDRALEFTDTQKSKAELIEEIEDLKLMISSVLQDLEEETLDAPYPMEVPFDYTVRQFLFHLYGHLNYHMGQFNYLRRLME